MNMMMKPVLSYSCCSRSYGCLCSCVVVMLLLFASSLLASSTEAARSTRCFGTVSVPAFTNNIGATPHHHHHQPSTVARRRHHHRQTIATSASSSPSALHYSKVFVAGGSRGLGRCVIDQILQQRQQQDKCAVVALVRDTGVAAELNALDGCTAIVGDAFDQKTVENAMDGCDAAITTLGGSTATVAADSNQRIDYAGNNNVIESAGILGIPRVVLVTSVGCGNSKEATPPAVYEALKDVLAAKERAENILIKYYTNMNWTIIRPGGLKTEPKTGEAILTEDNMAIGSIHREDLASLILQALDSANTERKVLTAIDPSISNVAATGGADDNANRKVDAFALA